MSVNHFIDFAFRKKRLILYYYLGQPSVVIIRGAARYLVGRSAAYLRLSAPSQIEENVCVVKPNHC